MGLSVFKVDNKDESAEIVRKASSSGIKSNTVASSYGSTGGVTSGGITRIRNKTIPIINPIVKSTNWPSSSYTKGTLSYILRTQKSYFNIF